MQQQAKPSFEELVLKYMANQDVYVKQQESILKQHETMMKQQGVTIQNLERQIRQLARQLQERPKGAFPGNTVVNPRETAMLISLWNGKANDELNLKKGIEVQRQDGEATKREVEQTSPKVVVEYVSPIPFPQRLVGKGDANNFNQFLETLKKIPKSIHVLDMIEQVPQYLEFLREVTMHKRRLKEHTRVHLIEECNAILQHQLPSKLKDPGSFTIHCSIGSHFIDKCLCDLGASVNLMPMSLFKKLELVSLNQPQLHCN